MPPPPPFQPSTGSATHRLARALLSASKPSRSWSPAIEQLLRFRLLSAAAPLTLTPPLVAAIIDPYLLPYHSLASGLFHWAAQQPNFSHTPETYHSLLKSLSLSRHPHLVRSLLKTAKSHNVPLLSSSYHLAISSLLKCGKSIEASELIDSATEELPTSLYNSLLAALSSDGLLDVARQVFGRMLNRNIIVNYVSFGVFIGKVCDLEGLDGVLGMLDGAKEMDFGFNGSVIASLIVSRLCRAGKIEDACCALEQLRNRGFKPDFIPYRIVSEGYILAGRVEEAEGILKKKRKYGVAPRANDYREFILSSISDKRIQEAKELGEAIVGGQFPLDNDVIDVLIGSVSSADPESAILFCNYMIGKDQFPSLSILSKLSKNLCRNQKSDEMWNVFKVLMDKGFFSGLEQYNLMVSFLCKAGRVREAYNVLREMKKNGVCPDIYSYNSLMEACCRGDLLRPAKKLWDEMFANGCSANLLTYNILINKFSEEGKTEEARHLYCHMLDKRIVPDSATLTSLITVLCREDRIEDAIEIYKKSMHQDKAIGSSVLRNLVFSLCKDGKYTAASGLIQSLPSEAECTDSHVILLKGLTEAGLVEMSVEHIGWVQTNVHSKFQAILTNLMASLSTAPRLEPVKQLLQAMHARGFVSTNNPWINVLESHSAGGC